MTVKRHGEIVCSEDRPVIGIRLLLRFGLLGAVVVGMTAILLIFIFLRPGKASTGEDSLSPADEPVIRFGIVTFYNPRLMVLRYQPLLDALTRRTPYRFELALARSYRETVSQLEMGEIDLAYLGPLTYVRARK